MMPESTNTATAEKTEPLAGLNPAQREAVLHFEGPMLVLAGAGSGKTRVITMRIRRLIANGTRPDAVLALTADHGESFGDDGALAVARASRDAVGEVGRWCEEQGVDAWFRQGGYMQVSTTPAHDGAWERSVRACRELGVPEMLQPLSPAEVAERCQSPAFRGGAVSPTSATVQPARLAFGLR